jgi:hypothetical protein
MSIAGRDWAHASQSLLGLVLAPRIPQPFLRYSRESTASLTYTANIFDKMIIAGAGSIKALPNRACTWDNQGPAAPGRTHQRAS